MFLIVWVGIPVKLIYGSFFFRKVAEAFNFQVKRYNSASYCLKLVEFETEIVSFRAIYTGENKTRTARINGTKQAFASYFRLDLHKTSLNLEQNVRLFLFGPRFKEARTSFNASK